MEPPGTLKENIYFPENGIPLQYCQSCVPTPTVTKARGSPERHIEGEGLDLKYSSSWNNVKIFIWQVYHIQRNTLKVTTHQHTTYEEAARANGGWYRAGPRGWWWHQLSAIAYLPHRTIRKCPTLNSCRTRPTRRTWLGRTSHSIRGARVVLIFLSICPSAIYLYQVATILGGKTPLTLWWPLCLYANGQSFACKKSVYV